MKMYGAARRYNKVDTMKVPEELVAGWARRQYGAGKAVQTSP